MAKIKPLQLVNGSVAESLLQTTRPGLKKLVDDGYLKQYEWGKNILFIRSDIEKLMAREGGNPSKIEDLHSKSIIPSL